MINLEYTEEMLDTGLSREQAIIYELLLKLGTSPASLIAKNILPSHNISRPLVYKVLEELMTLDLAEKSAPLGKTASFSPKHPVAITKAIDAKKAKIEHTKKAFANTAGQLSSLFNLSSGKPGVQFFEGKDGIWEVLTDSLSANEEIRTYADLEAIAHFIPELNAEYSTLREEKNIKKRGLVIDSPEARKFLSNYKGEVTNTKLIKASAGKVAFKTVVQIYDNKVSYITLNDKYLIGIIITDQAIADTHKYLFDTLFDQSSGEILNQ